MTTPVRAAPDLAAAEAVAVLMTEVSEGRLTADAMADRAVQRCREMFGSVTGPDDPLWPVHTDVTRQVLGHGGIPAAELAQWLSAARSRETPGGATDCLPGSLSPLSVAHSDPLGGADSETNTDARPVVSELDSVDTMDSDDLADVPDAVLAEAEAAALAVIETYRRQAASHDR